MSLLQLYSADSLQVKFSNQQWSLSSNAAALLQGEESALCTSQQFAGVSIGSCVACRRRGHDWERCYSTFPAMAYPLLHAFAENMWTPAAVLNRLSPHHVASKLYVIPVFCRVAT